MKTRTTLLTVLLTAVHVCSSILPSATITPSSISVNEGEEVRLVCEVTGSEPLNVSWTLSDGSPLPPGVQENGNELVITAANSSHPGTYVCSVSNRFGTRQDSVTVHRFSNPPVNFTCKAADQDSDITKPSVILNWERPSFQAFFLSDEGYILPPAFGHYNIVYEANGISETVTVGLNAVVNDSAVIDLPVDGEYTFYLFFEYDNYEINRVAIASCTVDTIPRRLVPRRLSVTCPDTVPDSGSAVIPVVWNSPQLSPDVTLFILQLQYVCLYNGTLNNGRIFPLRASFLDYVDNEVFSSTVGPLDPGTVCLLGGFYFFLNPLFADAPVVPHETCGIQASPSTGIAQLKLNCFESMAAVEVVTTGDGDVLNSTQLQGRCIIPGRVDGDGGINEFFLEPGNTSISNLPGGTICSFYGSYRLQSSDVEFTFEPAQCIVSEDAPTPPTTTSPQTTTQGMTTDQRGTSTTLLISTIIPTLLLTGGIVVVVAMLVSICVCKKILTNQLQEEDYYSVVGPPALPQRNANMPCNLNTNPTESIGGNQAKNPAYRVNITAMSDQGIITNTSEQEVKDSNLDCHHIDTMQLSSNTTYSTNTSIAPEINCDENAACEQGELNPECLDTMLLSSNTAYGTNVATAPEIGCEENLAYERRDTNAECCDTMQLSSNPAYGTNVAIAPEIDCEENVAYERACHDI